MTPSTTISKGLERTRGYLRQHGMAPTAARGGAVAYERARSRAYMDEAHVWYELDVNGPRPRVPLQPGLELRPAGPDDVFLLESFDTIGPHEARRLLAAGHEVWFVLEGSQLLFSCCVFHGGVPDLSLKTGVLTLPPGMAAVEDSMVAPAARGKAVGPAAWTLIADTMGQRGLTRLTTKVAVSNQPSRKAVVKVGFREVALVRYRKIGPWSKRTVEPAGDSFATYLTAAPATPGGLS